MTDVIREELLSDFHKVQKYAFILTDKKSTFDQKWIALYTISKYLQKIKNNPVIERFLNDSTYVKKNTLQEFQKVLRHPQVMELVLYMRRQKYQKIQKQYPIHSKFLKYTLIRYFKYKYFQLVSPAQVAVTKALSNKFWWFKKKNSITQKVLKDIKPKLKNGDIIIVRTKFKVSNVAMPGFWTHAMMYADGYIYESLPKKVRKIKFEKAVFADYMAVLRPPFSKKEKENAIEFANKNIGKPYDFNFDFLTNDSFVCTELVLKAYPKLIRDIPKIIGRRVFETSAFVKLVPRKLKLVLFLDSSQGKIQYQTQKLFLETRYWPRWDTLRK